MKHIKLNPLIKENLEQDGTDGKVWSDEQLKKLDMFSNKDKARYMLNKHPLAEENDLYFFIARPTYTEVEIDGETYHKKGSEIENLVKMDKENPDMFTLKMMKIRAQAQGDGSKVYKVWIASGAFGDTTYGSEIDPETTKLIMNKAEVV